MTSHPSEPMSQKSWQQLNECTYELLLARTALAVKQEGKRPEEPKEILMLPALNPGFTMDLGRDWGERVDRTFTSPGHWHSSFSGDKTETQDKQHLCPWSWGWATPWAMPNPCNTQITQANGTDFPEQNPSCKQGLWFSKVLNLHVLHFLILVEDTVARAGPL